MRRPLCQPTAAKPKGTPPSSVRARVVSSLLYVDAGAGVSGDMLLSAFLDMGLPLSRLRRTLDDLGLSRVRIRLERVRRQGIPAVRMSVLGGRRHDSEITSGAASSSRSHIPSRAGDLIQWIQGSGCDPWVKRLMGRLLEWLGRAEAAAHRCPWRMARFHQLGQADTLVVLAGLSVGLIYFGVQGVYASPVPVGSRHQDSHGRWQARSGPATERLLRRFPTVRREELFEWTTPTGAVFLSAFATAGPAPPFEALKIGHGVGHGRPPHGPTVLRLLLARPIMRLRIKYCWK